MQRNLNRYNDNPSPTSTPDSIRVPEGTIRMIPEQSAKLSPATKLRLSEMPTGENPVLNVLVRTDGSLDPGRRAQLEGAGATVRTVAGDVTTVMIPFDGLSQLASLEFVSYVEVSRPLYPELQAGGPGPAAEATRMVAHHSEPERPVLSEVEGSEDSPAERSEESPEYDEGLYFPFDCE
jgi:hypothetical protein